MKYHIVIARYSTVTYEALSTVVPVDLQQLADQFSTLVTETIYDKNQRGENWRLQGGADVAYDIASRSIVFSQALTTQE